MLLLRIWFYIKTWYLLRIQGLIKSDFTEISGFLWILFILFLKNCVTNSILEKKCLNFSTSTPTQSSQIFAILVPFCFIIITLMFFCRSKLLFFGKKTKQKNTILFWLRVEGDFAHCNNWITYCMATKLHLCGKDKQEICLGWNRFKWVQCSDKKQIPHCGSKVRFCVHESFVFLVSMVHLYGCTSF